MKKNHCIGIGVSIVVFLLGACKAPSVIVQKNKPMDLPAVYAEAKDTTTVMLPSWDRFFADAHLTALIKTGLEYNHDLQASLQRIQSAQSDVLLQRGLLNPSVSGNLTAGLKKFGLYTMDGAGNKTTEITAGKLVPVSLPDYFAGIQTSWEIDTWSKLKNKKQAAVARFFSTMEGKNLLTTQIVTSIAANYYELVAMDASLRIIDETILIREKALELVKVQKESAVANELAVKQFYAQLLNLRGLRWEVLQSINQTENVIHLLTGKLPGSITRGITLFDATMPAILQTGVPSALLQNRPDIRMAEWNVQASQAELKAARAAFYPTVTINGSLGFQAFKPDLFLRAPESIAYGLLGGLTAPLINRTAIKAGFQKANATQLETLYQYQKAVLNGYIEVHNELLRVKNLEEVFALKSKEAEALTQSISIAEDLFKAGRASYLEVFLTQQNALQARLALVDTKKKQFLTGVNLYKALGGGWQ